MRLVLEVTSDQAAERNLSLKTGEFLRIGRTPKADGAFPADRQMSAVHFSLECHESGCRIRDLNSSNGTFLNGKRITQAELKNGDEIIAGQTRFSVVFEQEDLSAPLPQSGPPKPIAPLPPLAPLPPPPPVSPRAVQPVPAEPLAPLPPLSPPRPPRPQPLAPLPVAPLPPIAPLPPPTPPRKEPEPPAVLETQDPALPQTPQERLLMLLGCDLQPLYALLDAAVEPDVLKVLVESKEERQSLFEGPEGARLVHFAPHLVRLPQTSPLLETLVRKAWGKHWGVFMACSKPLPDLRAHLRQFLTVTVPGNRQMHFRYYDPRILRVFLPSCLPEEINLFFGPVKYFAMEDEDPGVLLRFSNTPKGLEVKPLPLAPRKEP